MVGTILCVSLLDCEPDRSTRPAIITANPASATAPPTKVSWRLSSNAKTPSATLTTGSSDIWVAAAGARAPVWRAAELSVMPTQPTATSAYSCQCVRTSTMPSPSWSATALVSTALSAKRMPAALPSSEAFTPGGRPRDSTTSRPVSTRQTALDTIHTLSSGLSTPPVGFATTTNEATPPTTAAAPTISRLVSLRPSSFAPNGSAKTTAVASSGWTTTMRPTASAIACATKPSASAVIPASQTGCFASRTSRPAFMASSSGTCIAARC